nr:protease Do-like 1, chloroplastic isoform X2 [Setaria viridis]
MDKNTARILTCGCFGHDVDDDSKRKIFVHWPYKEDDGLIEAKLLFFSKFYQLSLLEVAFQGTLLDLPTQIPPFGLSPPEHGDEVFALGRDKDLSLVVRRGTISQGRPLHALRQGYLFVDYELPECNTGGPMVDHDGNVVGLSIPCDEGISVILPISTALSCLNMWTEFGRIARPLLGMSFRNVEVLDDLSGDIKFDGLVVDEHGSMTCPAMRAELSHAVRDDVKRRVPPESARSWSR